MFRHGKNWIYHTTGVSLTITDERIGFKRCKPEKGSIGYIEEGQYTIEQPEPFNMQQEIMVSTHWMLVND